MAQNAVVTYVLNLKGDLIQKVDAAKKSMGGLADQMGKTAKAMQQNQLISQFETVASLLIQVGGSVSQVGIIASSAARPVAILGHTFGAAALGATAAVAGIGLLAIGIVKATTSTAVFIGEMTKLRKELIDQGYLVNNDARSLVDYERAMNRLSVSTDKLKVEIADKLAPAFQEFVDAGTGIVRMLGDLDNGAQTTYGSVSRLMQILGVGIAATPVGAALFSTGSMLGGAAGYGQDPNERSMIAPGAARELLAPINPLPQGVTPSDILSKNTPLYGPEWDPGAQAATIKSNNEKTKAAQERLAKETADAYHEMQEAARASLQKISETQTKLMLQDWSAAANLAKEIADQEKKAAEERKKALSFEGGVQGTLNRTGNPAMQAIAAIMNPIGLVIGGFNAMIGGIFDLPNMLEGTLNNAIKLFTQSDELVRNLVGQLLPAFIRAMPEITAGFITIVPQLIAEIIQAAPIIFSALIEAILQIPMEIVKAIAGIFDFGRMEETLSGVGQMLGIGKGNGGVFNAIGRLAGIDLASKDDKRLFGIKLPSFDTGGMIARSGLAQVHAGERVLTRQETRNYHGGGVGSINVYGVADARSIAEDLRNKIGPYGLNLTLSPRIG